MPPVELTVLFATRNGSRILPRVLSSYCDVLAPPRGWKLVVVDNGSTDETPGILESFRHSLPLEVLHQPEAGKNRALNTAIPVLEGDIAVITDDDAVPAPSFLRAWIGLSGSAPDCDLFGGTIEPAFEVLPPPWVIERRLRYEMMFSARLLPEGPITWDQIYGPNMAVRKRIFQSGFRFDENIGPNALDPQYPMGSESEFCRRVAQAGAKCWFAAEARVQHIVRADQIQPSYWARRAYRNGRGRAYLMWTSAPAGAMPMPQWRLFQDLKTWFKERSPQPWHRLDALCDRHFQRGFWDEWSRREAATLRA